MMPAGTYYVGDLCYYFDDQVWDEVLSLTIKGNDVIDGEFVLKNGTRFAMYSTAYGDGSYKDQVGRSYGVDSGTIGCVQVPENYKAPWGGHIHVFDKEFTTSGSERPSSWSSSEPCIIRFGYIKIETNPRDEGDIYD